MADEQQVQPVDLSAALAADKGDEKVPPPTAPQEVDLSHADLSQAKPIGGQPQAAPQEVDLSHADLSQAKPISGGTPIKDTSTIGPRHDHAAPVTITGPFGGFSIPGEMMDKFHNFLEDVQTDVKHGSHATWVGSMLDKIAPGGWKGTHAGVSEGAGNLIDTLTGPVTGIPEALESAPTMAEGHPVQAINKAVSGALKTVAPLAGPEAIAEHAGTIATSMAVGQVASWTAGQMGADEDTQEFVGNVAALFSAAKIHSAAEYREFEHAVNTRANAGSAYKSRLRELDVARQQSEVAQQRAIEAAQKELNGEGSKIETDQARQQASEAAANQMKAQKAFDTSREELANADVKAKRFRQKVQDKYNENMRSKLEKAKTKTDQSRELIKKAVPARGTDLYEPDDQGNFPQYDIVRSHLEAAKEEGKPVGNIQEARNAVEDARQSIDDKVLENVQKYADEPLTENEDPAKSVKSVVRDRLEQMAKVDGHFAGAEDHLDDFNLADMTTEEAHDTLKKLNSYLREMKHSSNNWDIYSQIETNPKFAAYYFLADELRDRFYDKFESHGISGIKEARKETKSLIDFRNAADAQIRRNAGGTRVRGDASPARQLIGKFTRQGIRGAAILGGEALMGPVGGIVGAGVGDQLGGAAEDWISPKGMTRDQHIEKAMRTRGTNRKPVEIKGEGTPANIPSSPVPKDYPYPNDGPVALTPRENTDLHAELAAYYDHTDLSKSSYEDLENDFRRDMDSKVSAGGTKTAEETQLLKKILKADAADNAIQEQASKSAAARARSKTEEAKKEESNILALAEERADAGSEPPLTLNPHLVSLGRGDESGLVSHSFAMQAHSPAMEVAGAHGITSEDVHTHEWAHNAMDAVDGGNGVEIRSDKHPKSTPGSGATSVFEVPKGVVDSDGNVDEEQLNAVLAKKVSQKMAGPASHEVFGGMTKEEAMSHPAMRNDVRQARAAVRERYPDWSPSQVEEYLDTAYERAHDFLSQPPIADRIRANAAVREDGLSPTLHASRGRVSKFQQDIIGAHNEYNGTTEPGPKSGVAGEGGKKAAKPAAEGKEKNAGRSEGRGKTAVRGGNEADEDAGGGTAGGKRSVDESNIAIPKERSTGDEKVDAAIKSGGAIPGGTQKGFEYTKKTGEKVSQPAQALFHDPITGTSLSLSEGEITPEAVKAKIAESRKQYGIEEDDGSEPEIERLRRLGTGSKEIPKVPEKTVQQERQEVAEDVARRAKLAATEKAKISGETHSGKASDFVSTDFMPEGQDEDEMYHVTTARDKVLADGLKSRKQTGGAGLGGGYKNVAPDKVSVTYDSGHAGQIADRMRLAVQAARDEVSPSEVVDRLTRDAMLDDETPRDVAEAMGAPEEVRDDWDAFNKWVDENYKGNSYEALQDLDDALPRIFSEAQNPVRVGFTASKSQMAKIDPKQIDVLRVEGKKGSKVEHTPEESELRFRPEDVRVAKE